MLKLEGLKLTPEEKEAQRQFFFWWKPESAASIKSELRKMGRRDLIDALYGMDDKARSNKTNKTNWSDRNKRKRKPKS